MPAWSPEIANRFIALASADGRALDQIQLQKLVYIAHGWFLAILALTIASSTQIRGIKH